MSYILGEPTVQQYFDLNGDPLTLGTIEFYIWNTSTPTPIYSDSTGTSAGTSVTLDDLGAPENGGTPIALFFDDSVVYKIVRKDASGTPIDPTIGPYQVKAGADYVDAIDPAASDSLYDYTTSEDGRQAHVAGYYTPGDGGGGTFYWDASSTATDDAGLVILPTSHSGAGRWIRDYTPGIVYARWFGAKGDGVTDDYPALFNAIGADRNVYLGEGVFGIAQTLHMVRNSGLIGEENGTLSYPDYYKSRIQCLAAGMAAITIGENGATDEASIIGITLRDLYIESFNGVRASNNIGIDVKACSHLAVTNIQTEACSTGYNFHARTNKLTFSTVKNINAHDFDVGLNIDSDTGGSAYNSAVYYGVGKLLSTGDGTGITIGESSSNEIECVGGELGSVDYGIVVTGGFTTMKGEWWMEFTDIESIWVTDGQLVIQQPFRMLKTPLVELPGRIISQFNTMNYTDLSRYNINQSLVWDAWGFKNGNLTGVNGHTFTEGGTPGATRDTRTSNGTHYSFSGVSNSLNVALDWNPSGEPWCLAVHMVGTAGYNGPVARLRGNTSANNISISKFFLNNYAGIVASSNGVQLINAAVRSNYYEMRENQPHWVIMGFDGTNFWCFGGNQRDYGGVTPVDCDFSAWVGPTTLNVGLTGQYATNSDVDEVILFRGDVDEATLTTLMELTVEADTVL